MSTATNRSDVASTYRSAESKLWDYYEADPDESRIEIASATTFIRVQEIGKGDPLLFIHGGPNSGSTFAPLVPKMENRRCIVIDRPGTGLSGPVNYDTPRLIPELAVRVLTELLDKLGLETVDVVASSFGGAWALWLAQHHPHRVGRIALLGATPFIPGMQVPAFVKLMHVPILGSLMDITPPSITGAKWIHRQLGHSKTTINRLPRIYWEWAVRLMTDTPTQANDGEAMKMTIAPSGSHPDVAYNSEQLKAISSKTLLYWGDADPFGGTDVAENLNDRIPKSELTIKPGFGHLPWLDDPHGCASTIRQFLRQ